MNIIRILKNLLETPIEPESDVSQKCAIEPTKRDKEFIISISKHDKDEHSLSAKKYTAFIDDTIEKKSKNKKNEETKLRIISTF